MWTDTRTGIQELFTNRVKPVVLPKFDPNKWAIVAQILFGVINDGNGAIRIGGHIIPIGPWDPDGPIRDMAARHDLSTSPAVATRSPSDARP